MVPRVREFLEKDFGLDEPKRNQWLENWATKGLLAVEAQLAKEPETARFCHGGLPTIADICLASQVFGAQLFGFDTSKVPTVMRVFGECMKIEAFDKSQPMKQPGAPSRGR
jgi:maleylacetoacetate isomerase/maleylpyruvate isomerase